MSLAPLVLTPQHFGSLVFERSTSRYLPFDGPATALLQELADSPLEEVLSKRSGAARQAARRLYEAFEPRGFFTVDARFAGELKTPRVPADHLVGPLAVHLEVVGACNLACTHCFAAPLPRNRDQLSLPELKALFAELAALGSYRLGLTGGEPLLRRELLEIIDAATEAGLHPCLTTNGLLLDERWVEALRARKLVWLNVSLDGASAESNDAVRGTGTFDAVVAKLRALGKDLRFTLSFTVMRHNAGQTAAFSQLARELGAQNVVFRPLYPVGAAQHRPELLPDFEQYSEALLALSTVDGAVRGIDPFSPQARGQTSAVVQGNFGCGAGNTIATVSVRGDVNPCSFLGSAFDAANLRQRSFTEIWNESEGFRAMRALSRTKEPGRFSGGCRARALRATGDVDGVDPWQLAWEARPEASVPPALTLPVEARHDD
jgi:radical SAM protein with 4Fe4S-binding SPASM domain